MANAVIMRPLEMDAITPSATAAGFSADNLGNDYFGLAWNSGTGSATRDVIVDLGSDQSVDTIALIGLKNALQAWNWSIDLATEAEGAFTGAFFAGATNTLLAGANTGAFGKALWRSTDETSPPAVARYVRINFSGLVTDAVQVSRILIGQGFQPEINFGAGAAFGVRSLGTVEFSTHGALLRRRGAKMRGVGITLTGATRDEVENQLQALLEAAGNDGLVFLVTDPDPDPNRQSRMFTGFLVGDIGTVWAVPNGFRAEIRLTAID